MTTVVMPNDKGFQQRAVVFGGCPWGDTLQCSNDLYAYDIVEDVWEKIIPLSDEDSCACSSFQTANPHGNCTLEGKAQSEYSREKVKTRICPGETTPRPLGRYAHAAAYIESEQDDFHLLFVFGGRENADSLRPLDDLWVFDLGKMSWGEIKPVSRKRPVNRFGHSLTVWRGGAGDGVASLVVFGGQTMTRNGQTEFMNDVWLFTPRSNTWREVSKSSCEKGASGIVNGGNWTALVAFALLLALVVLAQWVLHNICPPYQPPSRLSQRRRRRKAERKREEEPKSKIPRGPSSSPALMGRATAIDITFEPEVEENRHAERKESDLSSSRGLLSDSSPKPSYHAVA